MREELAEQLEDIAIRINSPFYNDVLNMEVDLRLVGYIGKNDWLSLFKIEPSFEPLVETRDVFAIFEHMESLLQEGNINVASCIVFFEGHLV